MTSSGIWDAAGGGVLSLLLGEPSLVGLVFLALAQLAWSRENAGDERAGERRALLVVFVGAVLLHVQFGRLGWLYRYEAYLIVLGIVANAAALGGVRFDLRGALRRSLQPAACAVLAVLVVYPLVAARSPCHTRRGPARPRSVSP